MDASHWIGSMRFDLASRDENAFARVRSELRNDHERLVSRPLQQALDRADHAGRVVRHRRIEVDLGRFSPDELGQILDQRIGDALRVIPETESTGHSPDAASPAAIEQLMLFLTSGRLPWRSPGRSLDTLCRALEIGGEGLLPRFARQLKLTFATHPDASSRFVRQCPLTLVFRVIALLDGAKAFSPPASTAVSAYASEDDARRLTSIVLALARSRAVPAHDRRWLRELIVENVSLDRGECFFGSSRRLDRLLDPDDRSASEASLHPGTPVQDAETAQDADSALLVTQPLDAAGTILIHPFIAGLFGACGLLDERGVFSSTQNQARAVLLLHAAATGEADAPEPELALAKVLCGLGSTVIVPRAIELTSLERAEIKAMLNAVVAHWTALGDCSVDALRETFLRRPGRLKCDNEDWHLAVEQRGVDVLLDRLPWTIGMAMTPFMTRPLRIEWR